jgi:ribonuclease HI
MSKYYAVKQGRDPGIYTNWNDAKLQVDKFPNAVYKSFKTLTEAQQFIDDDKKEKDVNNKNVNDKNINDKDVKEKDVKGKDIDILVYTDGSYMNKRGGYAFITIINHHIEQYHGPVPFDKCTNQIAELYAIYRALLVLLPFKTQTILIRSDSDYSIKCLTQYIRAWKRNNYVTSKNEPVKNKELIVQIDELLQQFTNLSFKHVYAHQNEQYNEMVDKLAKLGTQQGE